MRHPGRQLADAGQPLGLHQPPFQLLAFGDLGLQLAVGAQQFGGALAHRRLQALVGLQQLVVDAVDDGVAADQAQRRVQQQRGQRGRQQQQVQALLLRLQGGALLFGGEQVADAVQVRAGGHGVDGGQQLLHRGLLAQHRARMAGEQLQALRQLGRQAARAGREHRQRQLHVEQGFIGGTAVVHQGGQQQLVGDDARLAPPRAARGAAFDDVVGGSGQVGQRIAQHRVVRLERFDQRALAVQVAPQGRHAGGQRAGAGLPGAAALAGRQLQLGRQRPQLALGGRQRVVMLAHAQARLHHVQFPGGVELLDLAQQGHVLHIAGRVVVPGLEIEVQQGAAQRHGQHGKRQPATQQGAGTGLAFEKLF